MAYVRLDTSYSDSSKVFTLGGNAAKTSYTVGGEFNTSTNASYVNFGFNSAGTGMDANKGIVSNKPFYLHMLTGTSLASNDTGDAYFDELYVSQDPGFTFDVNTENVKKIDIGSHATTVAITSAASGVSLVAVGNSTLGSQNLVISSTRETTIDSNSTIATGSYLTVKNDNYTANLAGGTSLSGIDIAATKTSALNFNVASGETAATLNLAAGTTGAKVSFLGEAALTSALNGAKGVEVDLGAYKGNVTFGEVNSSELSVKTAVAGTEIVIENANTDSNVLITATSYATLSLSGKGVETLALNYLTNMSAQASNWKMSTGDASAKTNVVDMGSYSLKSVTGAFANNQLTLNVGSSKLVITSDESGKKLENVAGVTLETNDTKYDALVVGGGTLSQKQGLSLSGFEAFLGTETNNTLDLGDVTDKKAIYLNNSIGGSSWGDTAIYNGITNVKTSSAGNTLLISDMVNKETSLYGAGAGDSLFGGVGGTYNSDMVDSLGSAQGKRGWFGSSNYSGHDVIIIRDKDNTATNNFDYADAVASDSEADVLALMFGAGYIEFNSGTRGTSDSLNFSIGSDDKNYMEFRNIAGATNSTNYHDFFYTYDLGATTFKARVDLTNVNTKGTIGYSSDIEFYLGQDDTKLTLSADISNENLNYNGGGVMMGIKEIDGSNSGVNNMLNGENNFDQLITASTRYATSICGGYDNSFIDIGDDTLVGGKNTTFFVGARMGDDRIENVDTGDTIVFLGSKYADVTDFTSDTDRMTLTFSNAAGGAKIRMDTSDNNTYAKVTNLTCEFDDYTLKWDGANWVSTAK